MLKFMEPDDPRANLAKIEKDICQKVEWLMNQRCFKIVKKHRVPWNANELLRK